MRYRTGHQAQWWLNRITTHKTIGDPTREILSWNVDSESTLLNQNLFYHVEILLASRKLSIESKYLVLTHLKPRINRCQAFVWPCWVCGFVGYPTLDLRNRALAAALKYGATQRTNSVMI